MKTLITTLAIALTVTAPAFANSAAERFALDQDSAAERIIGNTSAGDVIGAQASLALNNNSAAEIAIRQQASGVTRASQFDPVSRARSQAARARFALDNDSAAERHVFR